MAEHGLSHSLAPVFQRTVKAEKFIVLLLLFILLTTVTAGVTAVLTGPNWGSLWESLLIGLLVGWLLAILRWTAWRSALLVVVLGMLFCLLFAGGLSSKILAFLGEFFRLIGNIPVWVKTGEIDLSPLSNLLQQLSSATGVVWNRVIAWVKDLASGQAVYDPVAAGIVWSLVVWLVSAWAGWVVEAWQNALIAVLPALSLILSTLSYGRSNSPALYLTLGLTLVLIGVVQYSHRQQEWEAHRIAYPQTKGRQIGNASIAIAIALVVLAALISSVSIKQITTALNRSSSQNGSSLAKSLGIQQATAVPSAFSNVLAPGLPRELLIGSGPELSEEQVMSVAIDKLYNLVQAGHLPPLYWRSYTYDIYTGHGWRSSPTTQTQYTPDQPFQPGQLPDHKLIQELVSPVPGQAGTLYAAGEPVSADVPSHAAWRTQDDLFGIQTGDTAYTVQSQVPVPSEAALRAAGQDFPAWVAQRYLALPAEVSNRVRQLAIQLTATEPTEYDRAHAIEQYLRTTYPYTTQVPYPPPNQDLVDYFLFDLRKGYCDYYASAMVVLARAAGIPSRLAIGYATGTYNLSSNRFIVTQAEAHSWVEVFFVGIGWVTFEPTANQPAISRSTQPTQPPTPVTTPPPGPSSPGISSPSGLIFVYITLGVIAWMGIIWAVFDEISLRQMPPRRAAAEIYHRIRRYGELLGVPSDPGQTPNEYRARFSSSTTSLMGINTRVISRVNLELQDIIQRIVRLSYRPGEPAEAAKVLIIRNWRSLRWQMRLAWVQRIYSSIKSLVHDLVTPRTVNAGINKE